MFKPTEHLMNLKGKDYLQVAWRLVWFREDHPDWSIDTNPLTYDDDHAVFKCVICDENGVQKCAGHGSESKRDFGDFLEKAETKAVGRALAMLGYGTQFAADELDEGARIVDTPISRKPHKPVDEATTDPAMDAPATDSQRAFLMATLPADKLADAKAKFGDKLERMTQTAAGVTLAWLKTQEQKREKAAKEAAKP